MTNICAAIGLSQLEVADQLITQKKQIAKWYKSFFKKFTDNISKEFQNSFHSFWMVTLLVEDDKQRNKLRLHLSASNIETRPIFYPANTMKPYATNENFEIANYISKEE